MPPEALVHLQVHAPAASPSGARSHRNRAQEEVPQRELEKGNLHDARTLRAKNLQGNWARGRQRYNKTTTGLLAEPVVGVNEMQRFHPEAHERL